MIVPCALTLKECLPCNDDPIRNITAEAPDVNVFIGFRDFKWNPPLGVTYFQLACKAICFSEVSQEEANLCALRNAQECDWHTGEPPVQPPVPPGPNQTGGKGSGTNLPPTNPRNSIPRFRNKAQSCDAMCPDGSPFTETVPAGTITELSQALADEKAYALACKLAQRNLFCISEASPPSVCVGTSYFFRLSTSNGEDLIWSIDGDLPPGLSFNFFDATITGTPTVGGSYTFIVEVSDSLGRSQSKLVTICVMEIVTAATLPEATKDEVYAQPLVQQPATVSSEVWTLVSGNLPDGITLAANGALNGTPTTEGMSEFTLRVDADCDGSAVSCQKIFNLTVVGCDVEDPPLITKSFSPGANDFFEIVIPADKPGFYQIRYISGSQGGTCALSPPPYNFFAAFLGAVKILVNGIGDTANWINSNWIGNPFTHAGAIFNTYSADDDHVILIQNEDLPPGNFGILSEVSSEAWIEGQLTNLLLPPRYQKFCFEKALVGGETIRFEFNQGFYSALLCAGAGGPVYFGNKTMMALLRVNHCV